MKSMWLWVKNRYPKSNPGKWNQGLKPAAPGGSILTHTMCCFSDWQAASFGYELLAGQCPSQAPRSSSTSPNLELMRCPRRSAAPPAQLLRLAHPDEHLEEISPSPIAAALCTRSVPMPKLYPETQNAPDGVHWAAGHLGQCREKTTGRTSLMPSFMNPEDTSNTDTHFPT